MAEASTTTNSAQITSSSVVDNKSLGTTDEDPDSFDLTQHNPTRDILAEGIVSLLSPTIKLLDQGVSNTKRSQEELSEQIALLTEQLKVISAEQVCPIDLDNYVARLGTIKGKINIISSVLSTAQERLNRIHESAVKETNRRKPLLEPSPILSISNPNPSSVSSSTTSSVDSKSSRDQRQVHTKAKKEEVEENEEKKSSTSKEKESEKDSDEKEVAEFEETEPEITN